MPPYITSKYLLIFKLNKYHQYVRLCQKYQEMLRFLSPTLSPTLLILLNGIVTNIVSSEISIDSLPYTSIIL